MPRISEQVLREVEQAFEQYKRTVKDGPLADNSKKTYLLHAEQFVRWLRHDFEPGGTLD